VSFVQIAKLQSLSTQDEHEEAAMLRIESVQMPKSPAY
jgi:hypothetical protein